MAYDFCNEFTLQQGKYMIEYKKAMHRNRPSRMNDAEIMVILILFHSGSFAVSSITTRNMSVNI